MMSRSILHAGRSRHQVVASCVDAAPRYLPIISRGSRLFSQSFPSGRKAGKIPMRSPKASPAPQFRGKLPDYAPQLPQTLEFLREDQMTMEAAMVPILEELKDIVKPTPADVYRIYCAFHEAAKRACEHPSPTWEQDFIDAQEITPAELLVVARVLCRARKGLHRMAFYVTMADTAAALGDVDATISMGLFLSRDSKMLSSKAHFPRAIPRLSKLALRENNPPPDALAVMGNIRCMEGDDAAGARLLRRALEAGAARGGFELEAYCIAALGRALCKQGRHVEACEVLEGGMRHDTPQLCFEMAKALGMRGPRALELMTRAAMWGHPQAPLALHEYHVTMLSNFEGNPHQQTSDALEWGNIVRAYSPTNPTEAERYY